MTILCYSIIQWLSCDNRGAWNDSDMMLPFYTQFMYLN